jgi:hypothetical protein
MLIESVDLLYNIEIFLYWHLKSLQVRYFVALAVVLCALIYRNPIYH